LNYWQVLRTHQQERRTRRPKRFDGYDISRHHGVHLHGINAHPLTQEHQVAACVCRPARHRVEAEGQVLLGNVSETICTTADKVQTDLVVMATHGRTGVARAVRKSVADEVVRTVHAPVLLVRPRVARSALTITSTSIPS
jgi:nucleotide-binding universal stress UspA family protein